MTTIRACLLVVLLLAASPANVFAAIAEVGAQKAVVHDSSVGASTVAFPGNVTAGNLIILAGATANTFGGISSVVVAKSSGTATIGTVSQSFGATGVVLGGFTTKVYIAYAIVTGSGSLTLSITPDLGSGNYTNAVIDEFSGVSATPLDVDGGEATGNSAGATDTITTVTTNDLIVGVIAIGFNVASITDGSGYTNLDTDVTTAVYDAMFRIVTTATTYNVDWTWSGAQDWTIVNVAFKPTATNKAGPLVGDNVLNKSLVNGGLAQ